MLDDLVNGPSRATRGAARAVLLWAGACTSFALAACEERRSDPGKAADIPVPSARLAAVTPDAAPPEIPPGVDPECGTKPHPDCPLQSWMKANFPQAVSTSNYAALEAGFTKVATLGLPTTPNWASIAKDGAAAAHASNLPGVKAACTSCHDQYRARYRADGRWRLVP
jgi:hypothetical protein